MKDAAKVTACATAACVVGDESSPVSCTNGHGLVSTVCTQCAIGTFAATPSTAACSTCAAGSVSAAGATTCTACTFNTYAPTPAAATCTACPLGQVALASATACTACAAGKYVKAADGTCADRAAGATAITNC